MMNRQEVASTKRLFGDNDVVSTNGEKLGKIEDLVIDMDEGRVSCAVLSFGGVMGIGSKYFAIPWGALRRSASDNFVLDVDKEVLKEAPGFDSPESLTGQDRAWVGGIYSYYGYPPYWDI